MNVAGLDISTKHLDFVILNTENPAECEHRRVTLASEDGRWWESAREMGRRLVSDQGPRPDVKNGWDWAPITRWLRAYNVSLLGIERPYGPSRGSIASLHTILGAVLATIPQHITVLEVRPAEMRRHLGLKGNASKEEMHKEVAFWLAGDSCQWELWPPDALDAYAVANAAWKMCEDAAGKAA